MGLFTRRVKQKIIHSTLVYNQNGEHTIGGTSPPNLTIPKLDTSPVVYFGQIGKNEEVLNSIDFDLNLICPIYLNLNDPIFFDYSNPQKPVLIRDNVDTDFRQYFTDIPGSAIIEFEEMKFSFDQSKMPDFEIPHKDEIGHSGVPNWIQRESWPFCPISGKRMQFLFQLTDVDNCKTTLGQEYLKKEYIDFYLHFGHGFLYVFFEPKSRVIAYVNQIS